MRSERQSPDAPRKDSRERVWAFRMYRQGQDNLAPRWDSTNISVAEHAKTICGSGGSNGEIEESLPLWRFFQAEGDGSSL